MRHFLVGLLIFLTSCSTRPDLEASSGQVLTPPVGSPDPVSVVANPGDLLALRGRSIPIHPDFRHARTEVRFDESILTFVEEKKDLGQYGYTGLDYHFRPRRVGECRVDLVVVNQGVETERRATYIVQVVDPVEGS